MGEAEQAAGEQGAPAPVDAQEADPSGKGAIEREKQDAAIKGFFLQPRHGELEGDFLRAAGIVGEIKGERGEEGAIEQGHGQGSGQAAARLPEGEADPLPAEGGQGSDQQREGKGQQLALPIPVGGGDEIGDMPIGTGQQRVIDGNQGGGGEQPAGPKAAPIDQADRAACNQQ